MVQTMGSAASLGLAPMQKHRGITLSRLDMFLSEGDQFSDVNLSPHLFLKKASGEDWVQLSHYAVPDLKRIPFEEAIKGGYEKAKVGDSYGPSWSTHWFRVKAKVPLDWSGLEVQFRWNSDSEVLIWSDSGEPLQALTGEGGGNQRLEYILTRNCSGGEQFSFYLEVACNGLFGNGPYLIGPPEERTYPIRMAELAAPNKLAFQLKYDFEIIRDLAKKLPDDSSRGMRGLRVANRVMNLFERDGKVEALEACLKVTGEFLKVKGAAERHELVAVGHCHIDTAWLWPYAETKRKCARSWSTQLQLMEDHPDFTFVCSQAQQFEWLEENYPSLFQKILNKVSSGQFLPIGGTWVEMDCNVPSGEAFCRQFLLGQRYFEKHFGKRCKVFWLPDTFGYAAQLPQIIKQADMQYFFTQKLSWNNINKFPHTTFHWVGLDGTKVLAHMAPGETYNAQGVVEDVLFSEKNNKDKDVVNSGLYLFGNGDGGGGPLPSMIERIKRMHDVDGLPKLKMGSADGFYDAIAGSAEVDDLPEWHGELYLELHRGTYTSHGSIKKYNRYTELILKEAEFLATLARVFHQTPYPTEELTRLWKLVCLNQFHDVLPGSSIGLVYKDALDYYRDVVSSADKIIDQATQTLASSNLVQPTDDHTGIICFNSLGWQRSEVIAVPCDAKLSANCIQKGKNQNYILVEDVAPLQASHVKLEEVDLKKKVSVVKHKHSFVLSNRYLELTVNSTGQITSLYDIKNKRQVVSPGKLSNQLVIHEDIPLYWDGWDVEVYHLEKFKRCEAHKVEIHEQGPIVASLVVNYKLSDHSNLRQIIQLTASSDFIEFINEVDWHENRQFLKVEFPSNVHCDFATYETQFGVIHRPTHFNTSWDLAKFEVCSHRFADLSEPGYGVTIINDSKYGFATHNNNMRLSLLRSPKSPDADSDMGVHNIRYAIYPHKYSFSESNVVHRAHEFNSPLRHRLAPPDEDIPQLISKNCDTFSFDTFTSVIIDTIKISEDHQDVIIVRLYESIGAHANQLKLNMFLPIKSACFSNIMEDDGEMLQLHKDDSIFCQLDFTPFQIITLKLVLSV